MNYQIDTALEIDRHANLIHIVARTINGRYAEAYTIEIDTLSMYLASIPKHLQLPIAQIEIKKHCTSSTASQCYVYKDMYANKLEVLARFIAQTELIKIIRYHQVMEQLKNNG